MGATGDERQEQGIPDDAKASSPVIDRLFKAGYRFDFFQAVHLLEQLYPEAAHPGEDQPLGQEMIRFRSSQKRSFPATDVSKIQKKSGKHVREATQRSEIIQMVVTFMGLYGVDSPLPSYFSEMIATLREEDEEGDYDDRENGIRALRQFLDIFDHRIYSLYYRSWKKYRYFLQFEAAGEDDISQYMLSFIGLGTPALQDLVGVEVSRLISYAGILGQRNRCAVGLQQMLSDYFYGIGAKIIQFMPRWVNVPEQYRARLGTQRGGAQIRLGESFTIGEKIRDLAGKFRIVLAPLKFEIFRKFLPGGFDSHRLYKLVRFYAPDQLSFDVELVLEKEEVPPFQLGSDSVQLGWTSWLGKPQEDLVSIAFSFQQEKVSL